MENGMAHIVIPVGGMTCGGCVKSVEKTLTQHAGVKAAKASLEDKQVSIEFDSSAVDRAQMEQAIRKAGFEVLS
jgi:copper chaperone